MTINKIEKYLQDKVNINEITQGDMDFIIRQIDKIHEQDNISIKSFSEEAIYCIYRILSIYYIDFLHNDKTEWRTNGNIYNDIYCEDTKDDREELDKILKILVDKKILKVEKRIEEGFQVYLDNYTFSDAVINSLKVGIGVHPHDVKVIVSNDNEVEKSFIEPRVEAKEFLKSHFEAYQKYSEIVLNDLGMILIECFGIDAESRDGEVIFEMNGLAYSVYSDRGYFVLKEEGAEVRNWNIDSVEKFIDLIKDLKDE